MSPEDKAAWLAEAARRFIFYRQRAKLTVSALARASGVSRPTIQALEAGRAMPRVATLIRLQGPLGMTGLAGKLIEARRGGEPRADGGGA
jgi:transcriptional regulator with XRE-family HTH domain